MSTQRKAGWAVALALCAAAPLVAHAKDLGVQGTVFPIVEVDMRQVMREQMEKLDLRAIEEQRRSSGTRYLERLPKRVLPTAPRTATRLLDMSVTLTSAIQAPVRQPDGQWKWQVLHPAGTRVNPLDAVRPRNGMLFIDGSQPEQLAFAKRMVALLGPQLYLVEAGQGSIAAINEELDIGTYYGDERLLARFQVEALPSLLHAGEGVNQAYMVLTAFGYPFKAEDGSGWSAVREKLAKPKKRTKK